MAEGCCTPSGFLGHASGRLRIITEVRTVWWSEIRVGGQDPLAVRASKKLVDQELLIPRLGPARLKMALDPVLWKDKDHIGIKQLWEYFCSYICLPRLKDRDVLLRTIQDGIGTVVSSTEFAYAESYDEQTGRYVGLRMGGGGSLVMDSRGVLLKPEVAQAQIQEEDRQRAETGDATGVLPDVTYSPAGDGDSRVAEPPAGTAVRQELPRRFYASVTLDPDRVGRDAGRIADEILSRLSVLPDAKLRVSMEIEAEIPEGAPEDVQRTVSENSQVLKFDSHGFWRT